MECIQITLQKSNYFSVGINIVRTNHLIGTWTPVAVMNHKNTMEPDPSDFPL